MRRLSTSDCPSERALSFRVVLLVCLAWTASAYSQSRDSTWAASVLPFDPGPVIASVNGEPITREAYERSFVRHLIITGANDDSTQRRLHLQSLIDDVLLAQEATAQGLRDDAFDAFIHQHSRKALNDLYYYSQFLDTTAHVSDQETRTAYWKAQRKLFVRQLYFRHEKEANDYYRRLRNGEDFVDLANEHYNLVPYDSTAGWLGEVSYFSLDDAFAEAAWSLDVGEYSKPVRTRLGYHILRVENVNYNPLLTESAYQTARPRVAYKTQERRNNLSGDAWVKQQMVEADVAIDRTAIEQVYRVLAAHARREFTDAPPPPVLDNEQASVVGEDLKPDTPLAAYSFGSERRVFTAGDYIQWLPFLPYEEALNRTIPSVGRALRYEVFAAKAEALGLDRDPWLQSDNDYTATFYLADRMLEALAPELDVPLPDSVSARWRRQQTHEKVFADFWTIKVPTMKDARQTQGAVSEGWAEPGAYATYLSYVDTDVDRLPALAGHLAKVPLGAAQVVGTVDSWYVLQVNARRSVAIADSGAVPSAVRQAYNLGRHIQRLRGDAEITIDLDSFRATMSHYADVPGAPSHKQIGQ
ncbi:MAG: peptidylprolyl isomerase [Rhodothermales bacterium]